MKTKNEEIQEAQEKNREKILGMLEQQGTVTNKEFTMAQIGRFGASISQLRSEGYIIDKVRIPDSNGTVSYTLMGKGEPVIQLSATETLIETLKTKGYLDVANNLVEILTEANVTVRNKPVY